MGLKRTFVMVFKDNDNLRTALTMRRLGWTYESIAMVFGVDHSSIYALCKRNRIPRPEHPISLCIHDVISLMNLPVNRVKTYKDYLREAHERKYPKLYSRTVG